MKLTKISSILLITLIAINSFAAEVAVSQGAKSTSSESRVIIDGLRQRRAAKSPVATSTAATATQAATTTAKSPEGEKQTSQQSTGGGTTSTSAFTSVSSSGAAAVSVAKSETKQTQTSASKSSKPKAKKIVTPSPEALKVSVSYNSDRDAATNEVKYAISKIWGAANLIGAYRAVNVSDNKYEVTLNSYKLSPYISSSLWMVLNEEKACEIDTIGACLVIERDSRLGVDTTRAYYVGSAPDAKDPSVQAVVRRDVNMKKFRKEIALLARDLENETVVISVARDSIQAEELVTELDQNTAIAEGAAAPVQIDADEAELEAMAARQKGDFDKMSPEEKQKIIARYTEKNPNSNGAAMGTCWVVAKLKVVRRVFIARVASYYKDENGERKEKPAAKGKGRIYCYMPDGSVQKPKIEMTIYDDLALGLRSRGEMYFGATGIGEIYSAFELLRTYAFPRAEAHVWQFGAGLGIAFSDAKYGPALGIGLYYRKSNDFSVSANVALSRVVIGLDPDES